MRSLVAAVIGVLIVFDAHACTTAVVSGRATRDGRPILWKQRDTGTLENTLVYQTGGTYAFLSVHDLDDSTAAEAFMGSNTAGFSIINTASYNLQYPAYKGKMDQEGVVMKQALATCATLADFEALLRETSGKRGVEANFGVIDAQGGAAYYETDPFSFRKFDANDPVVAPHGYLIRTNFSQSGKAETGQGYIRYQTASDLFQWAFLGEGVTPEFIVNEATSCLRHSLTGADLARGPLPESAEARSIVPFADFIPRYSTTASLIMQGVAKGEDPSLTTIWTVLGSPLTTPVIPVWVKYAELAPAQLFSSKNRPSALNDASLHLKSRCFPLKVSEGKSYLDFAKVMNHQGTGTLQKAKVVNQEVMRTGSALLEAMRTGKVAGNDVRRFYAEAMKQLAGYYTSFGVAL